MTYDREQERIDNARELYQRKRLQLLLGGMLCFLMSPWITAQTSSVYSLVDISLHDDASLANVLQAGLDIDHYHRTADGIRAVVRQDLLGLVWADDWRYEVVVEDVQSQYEQDKRESASRTVRRPRSFDHFDTGSMGWYHTYDEMIAQIRQMEASYPEFVSIDSVGHSFEGRAIYAVKISDHVDMDESEEEATAYFDAITHAREPDGLFSILYFMWSLLEDMDTDPQMRYLIENRELHFIPVVNPDGYVFNQMMNPDGGGFWRKNRNADVGNDCVGVDLNRNFDYGWGVGASTFPCSDVYQGPSPASELETQAVKNYVSSIQPTAALTSHSYGDLLIFDDDHARLGGDALRRHASEFCPSHYVGYGSVPDMISYEARGGTDNFLSNAFDCVAYTPEIGTRFWATSEEAIWTNAEAMSTVYQSIAYVAGGFAALHDAALVQEEGLLPGQTNALYLRAYNRSHSDMANEVSLHVRCDHPAITLIDSVAHLGSVAAQSYVDNADALLTFETSTDLLHLDEVTFFVTSQDAGGVLAYDTLRYTVGSRSVLFYDGMETDLSLWQSDGWALTTDNILAGDRSVTESANANYEPDDSRMLTMNQSIDLTETEAPYLELYAQWSVERDHDIAEIHISTDDGRTWDESNPLFSFEGTQPWQLLRFDLAPYQSSDDMLIRVVFSSDGFVQSDGVHIDELAVVDLMQVDSVSASEDIVSPGHFIDVYPNPASESLSLRPKVDAGASLRRISVYTVDGAPVYHTERPDEGQHHIDVSIWPPGSYVLKVTHGASVHTETIVITR